MSDLRDRAIDAGSAIFLSGADAHERAFVAEVVDGVMPLVEAAVRAEYEQVGDKMWKALGDLLDAQFAADRSLDSARGQARSVFEDYRSRVRSAE